MGKWLENQKTRKVIVFGLVLTISSCAYFGRNKVGTYRISTVYDGDTVAVDMQGTDEKIRLIGMDTPETVDPRKPVQCYGPEASAYTHSQLKPGTRVRLVLDPLSSDRDRYGRLLRYVYLMDGTLYNQKLISLGYAHAYTGFPFERMATFKTSQDQAKTAKIGMWSSCPGA